MCAVILLVEKHRLNQNWAFCGRTWIGWRSARLLHSDWAAEVRWHMQGLQPGVGCSSRSTRWQEPGAKPGLSPDWWLDIFSLCFGELICRSGLSPWCLSIQGSPLEAHGCASSLHGVLRWCADFHLETSIRHAEIHASTWISDRGRDRISCVICIAVVGKGMWVNNRAKWLGVKRKE